MACATFIYVKGPAMVLFSLRGAEMLNIRINVVVDVKKVLSVITTAMLVTTCLVGPAEAVPSKPLGMSMVIEKPVTVHLTYMKVTTTKTEAKNALASGTVKYFDAEALAFLTVYTKNWDMAEWTCLRNLWQKESHFNPKALNMHSGAYGIAQFMPSTWDNYKVEKTADAQLQIKYGLRYIEKRYGNACTAWQFWQDNNWY